MDEETDGAGSKRYREEHHSEFPNHVAAIESDAGAARPFGFFTRMSGQAGEAVRPVLSVLTSTGVTTFQESLHPPGVTDIAPMAEEGLPILGLMQGSRTYYDYHHTAADTLDKVVPSELRENAAAMAVVAFALTNMRDPLPR
jgi:hypothetical protein